MASWDDVRRIALGLPETSERPQRGNASWRVREKPFVWERPLRPADLDALGEAAPDGPILGARVDLMAKAALLADDPGSTSPRPTSTATRRSSSAWSGSRSTSSRS